MTKLVLNPEWQLPDHIEIDPEFFPKGVGPGSMSPSTLRAFALASQRVMIHEMEIKSWVVLWFLDHVDWGEAIKESSTIVEQRQQIKKHYGRLKSYPPYVGGDDDEIEEWQATCDCGFEGRKIKSVIAAQDILLNHLNSVLNGTFKEGI